LREAVLHETPALLSALRAALCCSAPRAARKTRARSEVSDLALWWCPPSNIARGRPPRLLRCSATRTGPSAARVCRLRWKSDS
jgi:hypothetical protein